MQFGEFFIICFLTDQTTYIDIPVLAVTTGLRNQFSWDGRLLASILAQKMGTNM